MRPYVEKMLSFHNVPARRWKFVKFARNSLNLVHDPDRLVDQLWALIESTPRGQPSAQALAAAEAAKQAKAAELEEAATAAKAARERLEARDAMAANEAEAKAKAKAKAKPSKPSSGDSSDACKPNRPLTEKRPLPSAVAGDLPGAKLAKRTAAESDVSESRQGASRASLDVSQQKASSPAEDPLSKIKRLKELLDIGALTHEQFASKRDELLARV